MSNAPYSLNSAPIAPESAVVFAPLPLRARGVLEILDVAVKLLRQYWKPMLAWAAVANVVTLVANYFGLLVGPPFVIGPACCVIAAAVRGQSVGFKGCWRFTSPRVWNMIAMHVLSGIAAFIAVFIVGTALLALSIFVFSGLFSGASSDLWWLGLIGTIVGILLFGLATAFAMAWHSMVSMVVCMEDENRNSGAFKRAWALLRGRWKAAVGLLSILNLALLAITGALWGVFGVLAGTSNIVQSLEGRSGEMEGLALVIGAITVSSWTIFTVFMPVNYLALALFYLDARVRHEALDLEWNAHQTGQPAAPGYAAPINAPGAMSYAPQQTFFSPVDAPTAAVTLDKAPSSTSATSAAPVMTDWQSSAAPERPERVEAPPTSPYAAPETSGAPDSSSPFAPR